MKREYRVIKGKNGTTVVLTNYDKKVIKGKAKLADGDVYDEEYGVKLATLRCKLNLVNAKYKNAMAKRTFFKQLYDNLLPALAKKIGELNDYISDCEDDMFDLICDIDAMIYDDNK